MKCLPSKYFTNGFAAVRLISASGLYLAPGPDLGGPSSIFHDEGASTAKTGVFVLSRAEITERKGSRTSPLKLKPATNEQRARQSTDGIDRKWRLPPGLWSSTRTQNPL